MQISYNWLKQFIKMDWNSKKVAQLLTDLGLEVEGITSFESIKGGLKGVVVGHVLSCEKHSNADTLQIANVDIGTSAPVQIVCGATNLSKGQNVPVATIGTLLYTPEGKAREIKKGKIRGEESHGMICAEDELGLGSDHNGIMVLEGSLIPGTLCSEVFEIENDEVFEIGLTPNRADAMSHFGVARDLKAGFKQQEIDKELITPSISKFGIDNRVLKLQVNVENSTSAPRYCGLTLSNLTVKPSPAWLQNRLRAIGAKPINNVVDATNYVLHDLGQPLHAFDAEKVRGTKIIVKNLPTGTKFVTLDGVERTLHEDDLMICDSEKPMCIAGVFGGVDTGVTEKTTSIFLESAYFDPVAIRKTAKRHGLNTDASFRFERGIDIENVEYALKRTALLIKELCGGDITSDVVDLYPKRMDEHQVFLTFRKTHSLIGQEISQDTIKSILASLDIRVKSVTEAGLGLTIPSYRVDVHREVDVIEEILRVYGYNNIDFKNKWHASIASSHKFKDHKLQHIIGNFLAAQGYFEIMANSLTSPEYSEFLGNGFAKKAITIFNPLGTELSVMRQSLLFSGLEAISYNINRKNKDLKFFEFGKTYYQTDTARIESKQLSILLTGNRSKESWTVAQKQTDFYYLKSIVTNVLNRFGIIETLPVPTDNFVFSEGISLTVNSKELVSLGTVKPSILKKMNVKQDVLYAEFNWDYIIALVKKKDLKYREIPKYPEVRRDFALLLDDKITFREVYALAERTEKKLLKRIQLFDVYTGDKLPKGKKSYAVGFTLQDSLNTLTEKQIDKVMNNLQRSFQDELGAELR